MNAEHNHWQLYASVSGWETAASRLDKALAAALASLDRKVASGTPISLAANRAFNDVLMVMERPTLRKFGSTDSEPRSYLGSKIQSFIRQTYGVRYYVDRFGDVTEN